MFLTDTYGNTLNCRSGVPNMGESFKGNRPNKTEKQSQV